MKAFAGMMVAFLFLIPGAYSLSVSLSGGDAGSSFSDKLTLDAADSESLNIKTVLRGPALEQTASGGGDLHKSFGASSTRGERALITADVVNAGYWEYYQPTIYSEATSAFVTGFGLTATEADSIRCAASAADRQGDRAGARVEVSQGSLYDYWADAYANSGGVGVSQSFGQASGENIGVTEGASNPIGSTSTITNVYEGEIYSYTNWAGTFAYPSLLETVSDFSAEANKISAASSAYKSCGYRSNTNANIEGGDQNGYVGEYSSAAGVGFGFETGAQQRIYGAQGNLIDLSATSSNNQRDISSKSMRIEGLDSQPASIDYYEDLTESFSNSVFADDYFEGANGDSISLSAFSFNKRSDRSNANARFAGDGYIDYGASMASASLQTASASNDLYGISSADVIDFSASASNYARGSATVRTDAFESILGSISNTATADSSFKTLTAFQGASVVSGLLLQLDATAINAAREKENSPLIVPYPAGIIYGQGASVISGVPEVYQWTIA